LRTLHRHRLAVDRGRNALGHRHRLLTNTRHQTNPSGSCFATARSEYLAKNLTADILVAGVGIRHHALRRRQDGHAEAILDLRDVLDRGIDPATRLRDTLDRTDHRLTIIILQFDLDLGTARAV